MARVVRKLAIGRREFQVQVVRPSARGFGFSVSGSPPETARWPFGTVARRVYVALSSGWWLPGNQVIAPDGSPSATVPAFPVSQPSSLPSASSRGPGRPA